jgi:hypothetical protein
MILSILAQFGGTCRESWRTLLAAVGGLVVRVTPGRELGLERVSGASKRYAVGKVRHDGAVGALSKA